MFGMGGSELLLTAIVALIVVGPKDLPLLFRRVGEFTGKARAMAREFSRAMNDAADEAGVRDAQKALKSATDPLGSASDSLKEAFAYDPKDFTPDPFEESDPPEAAPPPSQPVAHSPKAQDEKSGDTGANT